MSTRLAEAVDRVSVGSCGAKYVLRGLADLADEADSCHPEIEWLATYSDQEYRSVQRHLKRLTEDGWIVRERLKNEDGTLGSYRFVLSLEKLGLPRIHRSNCPVDALPPEAVENSDASTGQIGITTGQIGAATGQSDRSSKEALPSFPISFFPSEIVQGYVERILGVCGARIQDALADPLKARRVVASLIKCLGTIEEGGWLAVFDFEKDILPTIEAQTRTRRKAELLGFEPLTADIWKTRERRTKQAAGSPLVKPTADPMRARIDTLRVIIAKMEDGIDGADAPRMLLPANLRHGRGAEAEAAWQRVLGAQREELAKLEALMSEGATP